MMAAVESITYSYRPSVLGATWAFTLEGEAILWDTGRRSGRIPLRGIRCIRLSFRPVGTQTIRYRMEIWSESAPKIELVSTSWKSMVEQERLDPAYRKFVVELHRRLLQLNEGVSFERGIDATVYWCGLALFVGMSFVMTALIARAVDTQAWGGAVIVAAFLALFLWQAGRYFRRNRPGHYFPSALPAGLIPQQ